MTTATTATSTTTARIERVTFDCEGDALVGHLHHATFGDGPAPAVAILGPMTFHKEQSPTRYARHLAEMGWSALVFDTRSRGESAGEPRCVEDPVGKGHDLRAALRLLAGRDDVDAGRLAVLGICMGAGHVLPVAADEPLVGAVATVAGQYRDPASDVEWLGGVAAVDARRARGRAAAEHYLATGEVTYVAGVDATDPDVGMPGELVWSWYKPQADRGLWEDRYAVMSDAHLFAFESLSAAARLTTPWLMVHSDRCAVPAAARRHFAVAPTSDKVLLWDGTTRHLRYYDDPEVIARTSYALVDWFARHLPPAGTARAERRSTT